MKSGLAETFEETAGIEGIEHTFLTTRDVYRDARPVKSRG